MFGNLMKLIFRRLFLVITIWLVLQIIQVVLNRQSPNSISFQQTVVGTLQWLTLVWFILSVLIDLVLIKKKTAKRSGLWSVIIMVVVIAVGELFASSWFHHPERIPAFLSKGYRALYVYHNCNVIQVSPECSEYDSNFYYNLKPNNTCTFSNIEFSNTFTSNSKGFRDDDSSLIQPQIICTGDSFMMGWGVDQQQALPAQLEQLTGKRTLNTAMSSFGTARELMRYRLLDTSAVQYLVIQYCGNDNAENKIFIDHQNKLPISSRASYDSLKVKQEWSKRYFPGKYFLLAAKFWAKEKVQTMMGKPPATIGLPLEYDRDARMFLDILKLFPINFQRTKIIVLEGIDGTYKSGFKPAVDKLLGESTYKAHFGNNIQVLDVAPLLQPDDFYILDGHFRSSAHRKIAEAIAKEIH